MSDFIGDWMWVFFAVVVLLPRLLRFLFRGKTPEEAPATRSPQSGSQPGEETSHIPGTQPPLLPLSKYQTSHEAESFNPRKGKGSPPPIEPR